MEPPKLLMRPPPRTFRSPGLPVSIAKRAVGAWGQVVDLAGGDELIFFKKEISNNTVFYNDSTEISQKI